MKTILITGIAVIILCIAAYKTVNKIFDEEWNKWGW